MLWPGLQALQPSEPVACPPAELTGLLPFTSGRTRTPSTGGTPDSLLLHRQEGLEAGYTPDTDPQQGSAHAASVGRPGIAGHLMQVGRVVGAASTSGHTATVACCQAWPAAYARDSQRHAQ